MNIQKSSVAAMCVVIATCGASSAIDLAVESRTVYFDQVHAKLIGLGYRDIRQINAKKHRMVAYDKFGSEVILDMHPSNRSIVSSTFVHLRDQ